MCARLESSPADRHWGFSSKGAGLAKTLICYLQAKDDILRVVYSELCVSHAASKVTKRKPEHPYMSLTVTATTAV